MSYGFVEGIAKGLNKLILLLLPFYLGTADFGKVGLIIGLETLLPFITLLGFERVILRFYSEQNNFKDFNKTINIAVNATHIFALAIFIILFFIGSKELFGLKVYPDIILIIILVYVQGKNSIILNKLRVSENHSKYFKTRLFLQIGKFLLILLLIFLFKSYIGYLVGGIIISLITNIIFREKDQNYKTEKFNKSTFNYFFLFSWPFIFHGLSMNLLGNADRFILQKFLSLNEVGLYTFAYSIGSMIVFAYIGVSVYMEPVIYKAKSSVSKEHLLSKFVFFAVSLGSIAYLAVAIASTYFISSIYPNYQSVVRYIPLIALAHLLFPYYLTSNYRMIYEKRTMLIAMTSIITSIINITLNFWLIPIYGIFAAVLVTFISYFIQAAGFVFVSNSFKFTKELLEIAMLSVVIYSGVYFDIDYYIIFSALVLFTIYIYIFKIRVKVKEDVGNTY